MSVYSAFTRFISDSTSSSTASHEPYSAVKPLSEMMPMFAPIGVRAPSISPNGPVATAKSVSPRPDCTSCVGRSLTGRDGAAARRGPACRAAASSSQYRPSRGVSERYTTCAASPSRRRCAATRQQADLGRRTPRGRTSRRPPGAPRRRRRRAAARAQPSAVRAVRRQQPARRAHLGGAARAVHPHLGVVGPEVGVQPSRASKACRTPRSAARSRRRARLGGRARSASWCAE